MHFIYYSSNSWYRLFADVTVFVDASMSSYLNITQYNTFGVASRYY